MDNEAMEGVMLSARTAARLAGRTCRTLQRWCEEGALPSVAVNGKGKRMIPVDALAPLLPLPLDDGLRTLLGRVEGGDGEAALALGLMLMEAGKGAPALAWFQAAAEGGNADAMHWLYQAYFQGLGTPRNRTLGIKWLAEAALRGHAIALRQIEQLRLGP
ncbi:tetratricopeptide repeat protein [Acidithiobacillus sulfuriphilus]|nr:sel1 repeat family protein [Acidithiobacillus sulfuriphilus]